MFKASFLRVLFKHNILLFVTQFLCYYIFIGIVFFNQNHIGTSNAFFPLMTFLILNTTKFNCYIKIIALNINFHVFLITLTNYNPN